MKMPVMPHGRITTNTMLNTKIPNEEIIPAATILPVGLSYEVTETVPDYYIQISAEGNIGKITGKETAEAVFTNHKPIGNLIVEKAFEGENWCASRQADSKIS